MAEKDNIFISQDKNCLIVHFPSHLNHINRIEEETRNFLNKNGLSSDLFPVCLAMREGLLNAVKHGNLSDPEKIVKYSLTFSDDILTMEIEDQGDGFDWKSVQNIRPSEESEHGRGIFIMRRYFSEFQYNNKGNRLTLKKYSRSDNRKGEKPTSRLEELAQAILQSPERIETTSKEEVFRLIECLYVRNNRLALQNAELRRSQTWLSDHARSEVTADRPAEGHSSLFQHNPAGTITVDEKGRITEYSLAKKAVSGRLPEIGSVMYKDYAAKHTLDMHAELLGCINAVKPKEFPSMEYEDKIYHIRIQPFPGGAIITSLDITSLKKAERKYICLIRATDESRDEIVVFDHKGYVDHANATFLNSRDVSLDTIIDTKYDDSRMEIIGRSFADKMGQVLRYGEPWSGCLSRAFSNGREDVFVSIKPVKDDNDVVMGYVAVSRPGTDDHTSKADA